MRENYKSGAVWEDKACYSRAVRIGNTIEIAGTTAVKEGKIVHRGNTYEQSRTIFKIMEKTLAHFGSSLHDVVRTRMFLRNIEDWEEVTKAHAEFFSGIDPASTLIGGMLFVDEDILVEIEATAIMSK
jgi:enamine deaminase RidA (YjgF/YER057c/UK114 family)